MNEAALGNLEYAKLDSSSVLPGLEGDQRPAGRIRVMVAHDHTLVREGIRLVLGKDNAITVVGENEHGVGTVDLVAKHQPDIVILDTTVSGMDVIEVILLMKQRSPGTRPLLLTATRNVALIFNALKAGAKGYLSSDASVSELVKAIQAVHDGELWVERKLMAKLFDRGVLVDATGEDRRADFQAALTRREHEVLHFLASGGTNKDIAHTLLISEKTVKSHLNNIFRKLQVTGRLQAVLYAVERGIR